MPYVRPLAVKPVDLSWDAFPAPTPEAEEWQPDLDSVPVAGGLPDSRFNKDPLTMQQKQVLKRDKRLGLCLDGLSERTRVSSPLTSATSTSTPANLGSWPAPAPRATGLPRALAPTPAPRPLFPPPEPLKPVETAPLAPAKSLAPAFEVAEPSQPANSYKCTMETIPIQLFQRPYTPPIGVSSETSEYPSKNPTPAWARSLAHLLGESPPKFVSPTQPPPAQAAVLATPVSKPPHLRKQPQTYSSSSTSVATLGSRLDNLEETNTPQDKAQTTALSAAPSLELTRYEQINTGASCVKPATIVEELKIQKSLLESFILKKPASSSQTYERYLQIKLINFMEDEMDFSTRMTRRGLSNMSEKAFDVHFTKTKTMHKRIWDTK